MAGGLLHHDLNKRALHALIERMTPSDLSTFAEFVEKWAKEDESEGTYICQLCGATGEPADVVHTNVERCCMAFDDGMKFAITHRGKPSESEWRKARRESADRVMNLGPEVFVDAEIPFPLDAPTDGSGAK